MTANDAALGTSATAAVPAAAVNGHVNSSESESADDEQAAGSGPKPAAPAMTKSAKKRQRRKKKQAAAAAQPTSGAGDADASSGAARDAGARPTRIIHTKFSPTKPEEPESAAAKTPSEKSDPPKASSSHRVAPRTPAEWATLDRQIDEQPEEESESAAEPKSSSSSATTTSTPIRTTTTAQASKPENWNRSVSYQLPASAVAGILFFSSPLLILRNVSICGS